MGSTWWEIAWVCVAGVGLEAAWSQELPTGALQPSWSQHLSATEEGRKMSSAQGEALNS